MSPLLVNEEVMLTGITVDGRQVIIYPNWVGPDFLKTMEICCCAGASCARAEKACRSAERVAGAQTLAQ